MQFLQLARPYVKGVHEMNESHVWSSQKHFNLIVELTLAKS